MSEPTFIGIDFGSEPAQSSVVIRREGGQLVHTLPLGAEVFWMDGQHGVVATIVHPGGPPYFLFENGRTEELGP